MSKDTLDSIGIGVRTQLEQIIVVDKVAFTHERPPFRIT
jgi:hypothetical protein